MDERRLAECAEAFDVRVASNRPVSLRLLSGFELRVDGARVEVQASAQRVLAYLALHDRPRSRLSVASSLWLDATDQRALANLRAALWKLHGLRDRVVDVRANQLRLAADVHVDVASVLRDARALIAEERTSIDGAPLVPAAVDLDLLGGDLLPDWDEDWIVFERERLRQLRVHAIEALSAALRACGRYADAVEAGLTAVSAEPLRESAHRSVIEAHLAEGNVADARRQFRELERILWTNLRIAPSPDLAQRVGLSPDGGGQLR